MKLSVIIILCFIFSTAVLADEGQSVSINLGTAKFNALLQPWFLSDSKAANQTNFRIRRSELKLSGQVIPEARWFVMIDPAKSLTVPVSSTNDNKILQDLGAAYAIDSHFEIIMGQFKIPTTAEGLESSGELLFPERSRVARAYGDRREPGAMLVYKTDGLKISSMASNGQSPNTDDTTNNKDLHFRVDAGPWSGFSAGAFVSLMEYEYKENGRAGGNIKYSDDKFLVKAEYAQGRASSINSTGYVGELGYYINEQWLAAVRGEMITPNTNNNTVTSQAETIGVSYLIHKNNVKAQAAYTMLHNMTGSNGSYTTTTATGYEASLFVAMLQISL